MNKDYTKILNKIFTILVVIAIILGTNVLINVININGAKVKVNESNTKATEEVEYDVSSYKPTTVSEINEMIKNKESGVIYLGRSSCPACVAFVPTLTKVSQDIGFTPLYLDITTVNTSKDDFKTFSNNLSMEITTTVNGEKMTKKISELYGYTPMLIIIEKGKVKNASVGAYSESKLRTFLKDNGIK